MLTAADYQTKAERYRSLAFTLPPNLPGPQNRDYYLAKAQEYESLALSVDNPPPPPAAPAPPPPAPAPPPVFSFKRQARVHSRLAIEVLKQYHNDAATHRAFTLWLSLNRERRYWFDYDDLVTFVVSETKAAPRSVERWLNFGEGLFWQIKKGIVYFFGKNVVFAKFGLTSPGRVQLIETDKLLGKLKTLRANLYACFCEKETKWASRETIKSITGVKPRSQRNYSRVNNQRQQFTFALNFKNPLGGEDIRQLPNRYHRLHLTPTVKKRKRYNLYTLESNGHQDSRQAASVKKDIKRVLFDNPNAAIRAITKRAKQGEQGEVFSVLEPTKRGSLLLKTFAYGY